MEFERSLAIPMSTIISVDAEETPQIFPPGNPHRREKTCLLCRASTRYCRTRTGSKWREIIEDAYSD